MERIIQEERGKEMKTFTVNSKEITTKKCPNGQLVDEKL